MRWVVGIDLFGHCGGALQLAKWLRDASAGREELFGVHVPDERLRPSEQAELPEQVALAIDEEMLRRIALVTPTSPLGGTRIVAGPSPDRGLARAALELESDGIVVGRAAAATATRLAPLGNTARRLLRHLPVPVMCAPTDLQRIGNGPIAFATDLGPASVAAGRFARRLADSVGRSLHLICIDVTGRKLELLSEWLVVVPRHTRDDVEAWARRHGLGEVEIEVRAGELVEGVSAAGRDGDAALVVCGSRCLSSADRVYTSSTAAELVRLADRPVLVVPE